MVGACVAYGMRYIMWAMLGGVCVLSSDDLAFDWLVWRERRGGAAGLGPAAGSFFANCHTQPQRGVGRGREGGARALGQAATGASADDPRR